MKPDFIIVGGGLAGTILAYTLIERFKKQVIVIDNSLEKSSSKVAAGIYNPITGKRMTKTWMANEIFPFLVSFYKEIEINLDSKLVNNHSVYKPFDNIAEQNHWTSQAAETGFLNWANVIQSSKYKGTINDALGGIESLNSGWLNCCKFLESMHGYLISKNSLIQTEATPEFLNKIEYNDKIIFCEGYQASFNPLWSWLPWLLSKGELLQIKSKSIHENIINKSVFICPTDIEGEYKVGSTFHWKNLDDSVTPEAKEELLQKLGTFYIDDYTIQNQTSGIRPSVKDRRPFIGIHPEYKNLAIFNGFGSKAVSLAPYFANHFASFLVNGKELIDEINIQQYLGYFYDSKKGGK